MVAHICFNVFEFLQLLLNLHIKHFLHFPLHFLHLLFVLSLLNLKLSQRVSVRDKMKLLIVMTFTRILTNTTPTQKRLVTIFNYALNVLS